MQRSKIILIGAGLLVAGLLGGYMLGSKPQHFFPSSIQTRDVYNNESLGTYRYTNELLACGDINNLSLGIMDQLKVKLERSLADRIDSGAIARASIYIRDLDNGPWIGINEKEEFYPASLLKVPFIFAAYKEEERAPGFLDREVVYNRTQLVNSYVFPPKEKLELGQSYATRELLRRSIVYSDNEAAALLGNEISFQNLSNIFWDFGITRPQPGEDYKMKVRTYASFFRILYNASYVSRDHSEEALATLTKSSFKDGIVAGVPKNVAVAHKFGEREGALEQGGVQLHDCGIVYAPSRPYLICVMAQASQVDDILTFIRFVSREAYDTMMSE